MNDFETYLIELATRFVEAYERTDERDQKKWLEVQEEVARRKEILSTLRALAPGQDIPDDIEVIDLGNLFDDEGDDDEGGSS
jgi:hypothetical protein